jgi:hypothetical protein
VYFACIQQEQAGESLIDLLIKSQQDAQMHHKHNIDIEIFYFAFGMLREAIWSVSPQMQEAMLKDKAKSTERRPCDPRLE